MQHINNEVLSLYYGIGQYISENTRHHFWGTGALKTISDQLQKEMPGLTGFGETSLKNMRTFYEVFKLNPLSFIAFRLSVSHEVVIHVGYRLFFS